MAGVNKVILMGNLVADPELRMTQSGTAVASLKIAVGRRFAKDTDEVKADFFDCVAWRNTAEFVSKYFSKGKQIVIVGSLQNRSWTDNEGKKRYSTEVIIDECYFCGNSGQQTDGNSRAANTSATAPATPTFVDVTDDELPF